MIEFQNIIKDYGQHRVLNDFSLNIADGELVVLIGESGCGKTTLLKMINYLIKPTKGRILINGQNITDKKKSEIIKLRRKIGYVVQSIGLFPHLTIKKNIELIPRIEKKNKDEITDKTLELMDMVGLSPEKFLMRYPNELSGGQQQRIGVARAFAFDPDIILMDEPFSALDPMTRSDLQDELVNIQSEYHKTIVFVTHDMDEAVKIADRICIMHKGKILQYDTPENILRNPADEYVENFVGKNRIWNSPEFITVKDIMIESPVSATTKLSVSKGLEKMRQHKVDSVVITDAKHNYYGIVSARRCRKVEDKSQPIVNLVKKDYPTLLPDSNLIDALKVFNERQLSVIPVVDDENKILGILTRGSLVVVLSKQYIDDESLESIYPEISLFQTLNVDKEDNE